MKLTRTLALVLTLLFSIQGLSKARVIDPPPESDEDVVVRGTSAQKRQDQEYQITAQIFGIGPSAVDTTGLEVGKFLDPNNMIFFEFTSGNTNSSWFGSDYTTKATSFGVHYKHFAGNSFYWRGGVDYRTGEVDYKYNSYFSDSYNVERHFQGNSIALNFQIGNQWQWDNFTMGCDWVGYSLPINSNITSERLVTSDTEYDHQQMRNDEDTFIKNGQLNLLRFYLGASF